MVIDLLPVTSLVLAANTEFEPSSGKIENMVELASMMKEKIIRPFDKGSSNCVIGR